MEKIKIYVHSSSSKEGVPIEISESDNLKEIIIKHHEKINADGSVDEEFKIFLEDADKPCDLNKRHHEVGIHHHGRVHCHQCDDIKVTIEYNNDHKHVAVAPSFTGDKILGLIPGLFPITAADVADLRLKIDDNTFLNSGDHIGSFVKFPHCKIDLLLVPKKNVQG